MLRRFQAFRLLSGLVVAVGIAGGAIGAVYLGSLHGLELLLAPPGHSRTLVVVLLIGAGLAIGGLVHWLGDTGDVELLVDNIHVSGGNRDVRALRSLLPTSLIGIAAGGALGPEAPLVQTGGTVATLIGLRGNRDQEELRVLSITGMAAAFTVLFGAPLGSAIFALEILHRRGLEYYEALMPALAGALIGFGVYLGLQGVGFGPVFELPDARVGTTSDLGWAVLAAVAGALIAASFARLVTVSRRLVAQIPVWLRPASGGLVVGILSLWSFGALTFGEGQIFRLVAPGITVAALLAALVSKLLASAVCLSTGWRGGFIIPLFFMGAAAGLVLHAALPGVDPTMLMAACMVAANVGVTKTPLGSTLVVTEMAGIHLLPTTTLAAVVAMLLTSEVNLITSQRTRTTPA